MLNMRMRPPRFSGCSTLRHGHSRGSALLLLGPVYSNRVQKLLVIVQLCFGLFVSGLLKFARVTRLVRIATFCWFYKGCYKGGVYTMRPLQSVTVNRSCPELDVLELAGLLA